MQGLTPEERFTRIENLLGTVAEFQAKQAEIQARHDAELEKHNATIDKHNAAIQDLIVVARTLLDSHKQTGAELDKLRESMRESIAELREAQQATDERLHILVETVDRIIRHLNR